MNQKQYQLISLFTLSEHQKYTYDELTDILHIGKRSINNYIKDINDFLSQNHFEQISLLPDNTLTLNGSNRELQVIRKKYFDRPLYEYHFSSDERSTIIKLLLFQQNVVTTAEIIRSLTVSKKTCLSDMKHVSLDLISQDIHLLTGTKGYSIDVNEVFRRDYLINSFHTFLNVMGEQPSSGISGIDIWISRHFDLDTFKEQIFPILLAWQKTNHINIEGYQFYQLLWILVTIIDRLTQGNEISSFPLASEHKTLDISRDLCRRLEKALSLSFHEPEILFLASYIDGLSLTCLPASPLGDVPSNTVIHTFLANISHDLKLKLANDMKLYEMLSAHIKSFFSLLERNLSLDQSFYAELEKEYPAICKSVKNNLYVLEQSFHREYNDREASFLVMHIAAAVSRILAERQNFKILLVCDSGIATASYITNKLKYYCKLDEIESVSSFEFENYLRRITPVPNLIISFYPLERTSIPTVIISPSLTSDDLQKIQEKMYNSRKDENNLLNKRSVSHDRYISADAPHMKSLLSPHRVALDLYTDNWKNALQLGGNLLIKDGLITQDYIDSIIRNVELNGPYFVFWPGVALAHADAVPGMLPFTASLIRLKQPVPFHNELTDPVKYILTFAASDLPQNDEQMISFIKLASSPTLFQHLDHAKTPEDACRIIAQAERGL